MNCFKLIALLVIIALVQFVTSDSSDANGIELTSFDCEGSEIHSLASKYDSDGSGTIESSELVTLLNSMNVFISTTEADTLITEYGSNGKLSDSELCDLVNGNAVTGGDTHMMTTVGGTTTTGTTTGGTGGTTTGGATTGGTTTGGTTTGGTTGGSVTGSNTNNNVVTTKLSSKPKEFAKIDPTKDDVDIDKDHPGYFTYTRNPTPSFVLTLNPTPSFSLHPTHAPTEESKSMKSSAYKSSKSRSSKSSSASASVKKTKSFRS